jgi:hypothetical protein
VICDIRLLHEAGQLACARRQSRSAKRLGERVWSIKLGRGGAYADQGIEGSVTRDATIRG